MIKIETITEGDRTITIQGNLTNNDTWREYLFRIIMGIINTTDYATSDTELTRKINEFTQNNQEQEVYFIISINKP